MKKRMLLVSLIGVLVAVVGLAGSLLLFRSDGVDLRGLSETELRQYADKTVGVQEIIDIFRRDTYASFRTDGDKRAHDDAESQWLDDTATDKEIERWWYVAAL